jgi:hypothetical protein
VHHSKIGQLIVSYGSCMDGTCVAREKNLAFRETPCIRPLSATVWLLALT